MSTGGVLGATWTGAEEVEGAGVALGVEIGVSTGGAGGTDVVTGIGAAEEAEEAVRVWVGFGVFDGFGLGVGLAQAASCAAPACVWARRLLGSGTYPRGSWPSASPET